MRVEVFLDLDGVLADLRAGMAQAWPDAPAFAGYPTPNDQLDPVFEAWFRDDARWTGGPVCDVGFWANLPLCPEAEGLLHQLRCSLPVFICSSPGRPEFVAGAAAGKHLWCAKQHLAPRQVILADSRFKHMLAAPGRVLIDDTPHIVDRWNAAGGIGILYPQPWNRSPTDHLFTGDRLDWVRDEIERRVMAVA